MSDPISKDGVHVPSATYRVQFGAEFGFRDAGELSDYLAALGISDLYASPVFTAPATSTHGYDVCNFSELNPALGGEPAFAEMVARLQSLGMGLLVDFVPNHMGGNPTLNHWWRDVLKHGRGSQYSDFFDIDWDKPDSVPPGKLLLPVLTDYYGKVLDRGSFAIAMDGDGFWINVGAIRLPLSAESSLAVLNKLAARLDSDLSARLREFLNERSRATVPFSTKQSPALDSSEWDKRWDAFLLREPKQKEALINALGSAQKSTEAGFEPAFIHQLLESQAYRLSYWRHAVKRVNFRRFFEISGLVALRMERPTVFEAAHRFLMELVDRSWVTGVRIDHVDGLYDPKQYLRRLSELARKTRTRRPGRKMDRLYIVVEKILLSGEALPPDWQVQGTTGYEFCPQVTGILIDRTASESISQTYSNFSGERRCVEEIVYDSKKLVMTHALSNEVNWLGRLLFGLAQEDPNARELPLEAWNAPLCEVIASLPVYRTYLAPGQPPNPEDLTVLQQAFRCAHEHNPELDPIAMEFLERTLLAVPAPKGAPTETCTLPIGQRRTDFIMRFQQFTGPIMAKGYEDTAFYRYNRLSALNEVGGNPGVFGQGVEKFHQQNSARLGHFPDSLLATSTHDTKMSEDVRCRLAAISEIPTEWRQALELWTRVNSGFKTPIRDRLAPDPNEEYLFYQMLLGTWPLQPLSLPERDTYVKRLQDYLCKAINEAKMNSRWDSENSEWLEAVRRFISQALQESNADFWSSIQSIANQISELGAINSLSQTLIKMTVPGVPDFYQGSELWSFNLVDPDNRRRVDFKTRRAWLAALSKEADSAALLKDWRSGRIKLFLIQRALHFRRSQSELFCRGNYFPVNATGTFAESCFSFARMDKGHFVLIAVPRLSCRVGFPPIGKAWADTDLDLDPLTFRGELIDIFTGRQFKAGRLPLSALLHDLPFAMLEGHGQES